MRDLLGIGIAVLAITGGLGVAYYSLWLSSKSRELKHRERLAMIEKGLMPSDIGTSSPELEDPLYRGGGYRRRRDGGVMMLCIGIAVMMFFGLSTGNWRSVWMGGFIVMFGLANLIIALLNERDDRMARRRTPPTGEPL